LASDDPFETHYEEYDAWFDAHADLYESELLAIQSLLPERRGRWLEVGVGSGRFASRLGIEWGVEPAAGIARLATARGIHVLRGTAQALPLDNDSVDVLFLISVLCFVEDLDLTLREACRVLVPGGHAIVALIPKESTLGRLYSAKGIADRFFARATLHEVAEVVASLERAGLRTEKAVQTLTDRAGDHGVESPSEGSDRGSFVVLRAVKPGSRLGVAP
jgi:SAM-dependent methyltransferase